MSINSVQTLPTNWKRKKISQISVVKSSTRIHEKDWTKHGIPFFRAREIVALDEKRNIENPIYISREMYDEIKKNYPVPQKGDILVTGVGTIGVPYIVQDNAPFYFKDGNLIWISNFKDVTSEWIYFCLKYKPFIKEILTEVGSSVQTFTITQANNLELPLPPLPEQKKIAEILSTWDEAIETNTKLLNSIEKYRVSQLSNYFLKAESSSAKKSLEELENSGSIKLGRGRVISRDEMKSSKGLFPVYSSSIKNNGLMGYIDEYLFDEEMITWSIDGGGNFFYRERHKFSVTNVSGFLKIMDGKIKPYFLANQLQYLHSRLVFDYQTKAHPSVIRSLYKVQIPSINEQIRFEYLFKSFDTQIEKISQYINELQKQKQGLMQRLLTGKVRVKLD